MTVSIFDAASIITDSNNAPHIIFNENHGSLTHLYKDAGQWTREYVGSVSPDPQFCTEPRVVIDKTNVVHIAYYDE